MRDGKNGAARGLGGRSPDAALRRSKRRRRSVCGVGNPRLLGYASRDPEVLRVGGDGSLEVQGHLAKGRGRRRPQRVPDEEDHPGEQPDGERDHADPYGGAARTPPEAGGGELDRRSHAGCLRSRTPSASSMMRSARSATPWSWVAVTIAKPNIFR